MHALLDSVVFVGPSARPEDRASFPAIEWRPPVRRGDLGRLPGAIRCVGIVDGEFDQSLAVSPREILQLVHRGVTVLGASSMGALRAAELHAAGMRGLGRIFEMYRNEEVVADDEVALVFDPESLRPLSEPLVNVRCAVQHGEDAHRIASDQAHAIIDAAQALPYPARTYRRILKDAGSILGADVSSLESVLTSHDQKRLDAILLFGELNGSGRRDSA